MLVQYEQDLFLFFIYTRQNSTKIITVKKIKGESWVSKHFRLNMKSIQKGLVEYIID